MFCHVTAALRAKKRSKARKHPHQFKYKITSISISYHYKHSITVKCWLSCTGKESKKRKEEKETNKTCFKNFQHYTSGWYICCEDFTGTQLLKVELCYIILARIYSDNSSPSKGLMHMHHGMGVLHMPTNTRRSFHVGTISEGVNFERASVKLHFTLKWFGNKSDVNPTSVIHTLCRKPTTNQQRLQALIGFVPPPQAQTNMRRSWQKLEQQQQ